MAVKYKSYNDFSGGINDLLDAKDLGGSEWAELQNVSIERRGIARSQGALAAHDEVPAQTAVICPGSGLKVFSSDHWIEGSPTVVDELDSGNAVSDRQTEADSTSGWIDTASITTTSVADTDGGAIASNGTSYVFKHVGSGGHYCYNQDSVVAGREYELSVDLYCVEDGADSVAAIVYDVGSNTIIGRTNPYSTAAWANFTLRFTAIGSLLQIRIIIGGASVTAYSDDIYVTAMTPPDIVGDWLALTDVANAQVDLYSDNTDSFTAGLLDFGTVSTYAATADTINFPTTSTITDSNSKFFNKGMQPGQVWKISGCTSETANNILVVLERVTAGTLYVRGTPLTVRGDEDGAVTFTKYNSTSFHFVNEALRASPVGGGFVLRPKHYSFVDRTHFYNASSLEAEDKYFDWYLNDCGLVAPTDQYVETSDSDGDRDITGDVTAGAGFEIAVTDNASAGEWPAKTWEVATTFIYDDGQESELYVPSTAQTFTSTEASSQDVCVRAHNTGESYDERISGGRAYCRETLSDDPWVLLVDIDMKQGARATLSGQFNEWEDGSTDYVIYSDGFDSFRRNLDTYESLTGRDPSVSLIPFTSDNTFWDASCIAGSRCFLASARYEGAGGAISYFRDRILYSQVGQYDVFPIGNYIDVIRGDADDYVRLVHFNDRLLAFKQRNLFIINIADSNPSNWFLEDTHYFRGAQHPGAVFMTPYGPFWVNEQGAFIYDGARVVNLISGKLDSSTWSSFATDYSICGYHAQSNTGIVMADCTDSGTGLAYFYDFDTGGWTYGSGVFTSSVNYTNFETDWNQDLIVGEANAANSSCTVKKWDSSASSTAQNAFIMTSKDDNLESEVEKSLLAVIVHYKSSAAQTDVFYYATNGGGSFVNTNFTADNEFADTGDGETEGWTRVVWTPSTATYFYSLQWRLKNTTAATLMQVNDVTLMYTEEFDKVE